MTQQQPQTTLTENRVSTNLSHDKTALTISFDGRQEQLPQPTKEATDNISALIFLALSVVFTTALVTQILLALSLPIISFDRLLSAVVGVALLGIGLHWSIRSRLETSALLFCFSVVAGVVLGRL
ncbi:MAG: hypothetical protein V7K68_12720 [Nostoc sp.]|uniref:hypothetical protein n=1 Tax=Nostoc sp. TaxID=1180 RepID=UPI002FFC9961